MTQCPMPMANAWIPSEAGNRSRGTGNYPLPKLDFEIDSGILTSQP